MDIDFLISKQRELIAKVNNALTDWEHGNAWTYLQGWRDGVFASFGDEEGHSWVQHTLFVDSDMHHRGEDAERPMCLGCFLDWKSEEQRKKDFQEWELMDTRRARGSNY